MSVFRALPLPSGPVRERLGYAAWTLAYAMLLAVALPASAQETAPEAPFVPSLPATVSGVPGTWDLSRDGSTRRCVMTLSSEAGIAGRRLRFPAGCNRALPILGAVAGWLYTDAGLRLVDKDLRPILLFGRRPDQRSLLALAQSGETYSLVPLEIAAMATPKPEDTTAPNDAPQGEATGTVAAPAANGPSPGVYALDRFRDKDVCRLDLMAAGAKPGPVRVVDGCRDSGLSVFDPVSWSFGNGRLTLTARRGHTVDLVPMGEGVWRREPETGTTFVLRRIEP